MKEMREATEKDVGSNWKRCKKPLEEMREATGRDARSNWKRCEKQ
jgi:hypothetical protein